MQPVGLHSSEVLLGRSQSDACMEIWGRLDPLQLFLAHQRPAFDLNIRSGDIQAGKLLGPLRSEQLVLFLLSR